MAAQDLIMDAAMVTCYITMVASAGLASCPDFTPGTSSKQANEPQFE